MWINGPSNGEGRVGVARRRAARACVMGNGEGSAHLDCDL